MPYLSMAPIFICCAFFLYLAFGVRIMRFSLSSIVAFSKGSKHNILQLILHFILFFLDSCIDLLDLSTLHVWQFWNLSIFHLFVWFQLIQCHLLILNELLVLVTKVICILLWTFMEVIMSILWNLKNVITWNFRLFLDNTTTKNSHMCEVNTWSLFTLKKCNKIINV
jgi:hypothetical protein